MLKLNKVKELPVNTKPSLINDIYEKGNKLLLYFNEDTEFGNVSELSDVTDGNLTEVGDDVRDEDIDFMGIFKAVNGKVVVKGGSAVLLQRFLYEDGEANLGVIMPCKGEWGKYELSYYLYGTGDTYKIADKVEEVEVSEYSIRDMGSLYRRLDDKMEVLNSMISSGYLDVFDFDGKKILRFLADIEKDTGNTRLLANVNNEYMQCIRKGSVTYVFNYVLDVLTNGVREVHLENLE